MSLQRDSFAAFLLELGIQDAEGKMQGFDHYLELLVDFNARVNLVSRATPIEDYWTKHFLDSLMLLKCVDLTGAKVLDFGTGGGFPGLPLKLTGLACKMTLLDSISKKANALGEIVRELAVPSCRVVCSRLEDHKPAIQDRYDVVLCRAVRMEQRYATHLDRLLSPGGCVIFYKSAAHDDLDGYEPSVLLDSETDWGRRMILSVSKAHLRNR